MESVFKLLVTNNERIIKSLGGITSGVYPLLPMRNVNLGLPTLGLVLAVKPEEEVLLFIEGS